MQSSRKDANSPDFIQIPPELRLRGIRAELGQVPPEEHLPALDLGTFFIVELLDRSFVGSIPCVESPGRDILFKKFLVDDVDDSGDEGFDVFGAGCQGFDVS